MLYMGVYSILLYFLTIGDNTGKIRTDLNAADERRQENGCTV